MVMFYPAEGCRCGHCHAAPPAGAYPEGPDYAPEDGPLPSDSPCAGPGGACGCYGEGYAAGKDKAHFEVRALAEGPPHGSGAAAIPAVPSVRYSRPGGAGVQGGRSRCQL